MKKRITLFTLAFFVLTMSVSSGSFTDEVCHGDITLSSQAEVDAFTCTEVGRFLRITGNDITNLDALSSLKKVGALVIENNPNLRNVDGLSALSKTGVQDRSASFSIRNNPMLTNLDGFQSLDSVGGDIFISGNASLKTINGFSALKQMHSLTVSGNDALETIGGFNNVTEMRSYSAGGTPPPVSLTIESNPALQNIEGFSALRSLYGMGGVFLRITNNNSLTHINGLSSLVAITTLFMDARLVISNNSSLKNLDGLSSLHQMGWGIFISPFGTGSIEISNNTALENIDGLAALQFHSSLLNTLSVKVRSNPSLIRCCGLFPALQSLGPEGISHFEIFDNGAGCTVDDILAGGACSPKVCEGDVVLTSQAEVDAFQCDKITGSLTISGNDITNLNSLLSLKKVGGTLTIENNSLLENLNGLNGIEIVNGGMLIQENNSLASINGFGSLASVGERGPYAVFISSNPSLQEINGFSALATIQGILIEKNNSLVSINGFSNLTTDYGFLEIADNNSLEHIDGFKQVKEIKTGLATAVIIDNNPALQHLDGLSSLSTIEGPNATLRISNNASLSTIDGLHQLSSIVSTGGGASLKIENNDALKNIDGLSSLTTLEWQIGGDLTITGNAALENVDGLSILRLDGHSISSLFNVIVTDNPSLTQCCGLPFLNTRQRILGTVNIANNGAGCTLYDLLAGACSQKVCEGDVLLTTQAEVEAFQCNIINGSLTVTGGDITNLNALSALRMVRGNINIENNPALTNLNGLNKIDSVGGPILINGNNNLMSVNGFGALVSIGGDGPYAVTISSNPNLVEVNGFSSMVLIRGILIKNNNALVSVNGFSNLVVDYGLLEVTNNNSLTNINGFKKLRDIRPWLASGLILDNNPALGNVDGLSSLTVIEGPNATLRISNNASLSNMDGLMGLLSIKTTRGGAALEIENNDALKNVDGLLSLTRLEWDIVGSLLVSGNQLLENVDGLSALTFDGNSIIDLFHLTVADNPSLTLCCGLFPFLNSVGQGTFGMLNIANNGAGCTVNDILVNCQQKVCDDNVVLTSQAEVDAFDCEIVKGKLTISGNDIINLDGLNSLKVVRGGILIDNNQNLESIAGLSSLTFVTGLHGLEIMDNPKLAEIHGFPSLKTVSVNMSPFVVTRNSSLIRISGFAQLTTLSGGNSSVWIGENESLIDIGGFSSLTGLGGLNISNNLSLVDINAFANVTTAIGLIEISNNYSLKHFYGFKNLIQVIDAGFEPFVRIDNNHSLLDLDGFSSLQEVHGSGAQFVISNNPSLLNIDGLSLLTSIIGGGRGASFVIENNDVLRNLDGLRSFSTFDWGIGGGFIIKGNELLENIDGLSSLHDKSGIVELLSIRVKDNPSLTKCCGLFPWFKSIGASRIPDIKEIDFSNNGGGCTLEDILACEGQSISDFSLVDRSTGDVAYSSSNDELTINVANESFPNWLLQAHAFPTQVGSVEFIFDNSITHVENVLPYQFEFPALELGTHTIVTNVYSGPNKTGTKGQGRTLTLIVVNSAMITNFDVVNTSGGFLMNLTEDSRINIANPAFNLFSIRANTSTYTVTSVKFWLNGQFFRVENVPPYAFNGDNNGIYNPWIVDPWNYTIKAIPYIRVGGKEYAGEPLEVHFKVVRENLSYAVVGFDIVDISGNLIQHLSEGATISNDQLMTIIANTTGQVGSVKFDLNNQFYRTENVPPYTITGDQNGYFNPWVPQAGNYTLTGTPYSATGSGGEAGTSLTIHFTMANKSKTGPARSITSSDNNSEVELLPSGERLDLIVHPVPVYHELHVEIFNATEEALVTIVNIQGLILYKGAYSESSVINTQNLKAGIYFLQVVSRDGHQKMVKFIKE